MADDLILASAAVEHNRAQRLELVGLDVEGRTLTLDQTVDRLLANSETLEDVARVLYNLLAGGYSVWTDGCLVNTRALVGTIGSLRIEIRLNEHAPPHFHVTVGNINASFTVRDCVLLAGKISRGDRNLVERWHAGARAMLIRKWNDTRPSNCPVGPISET